MPFLNAGFLGGGKGRGAGALTIAKISDGTDAVFRDLNALKAYYQSNPKPKQNEAAAVGTKAPTGEATSISAAYVYHQGKWESVATNFIGSVGKRGQRGKTGAGVDPSALTEGAIPRWDAANQKLVSSGVISENDGELKISPSSIFFGNHAMEASLENVVFRNLQTHRVYAPLWQEVAPGQDVGYVRSYSSTIDKIVRVPDGNIDVTNPVNENVQVGVNEVFLGGNFTLSQDATDLVLEIYDHADKSLIWRQRLGNQVAGEKNITFEVPFDVRAGYSYDIKLLSADGSNVVAKSNSSTGFSWTINRALWKDIPVATQDWTKSKLANIPGGQPVDASSPIVKVSLSGDQLTFTHADTAKHVIQLPTAGGSGSATDLKQLRDQITLLERDLANKGNDINSLKNQYGQLDHKIEDLSGTYSYDGNALPDYPDDPKHSYFVHLHGTAARDIMVDLPNPTGGPTLDGTMFVLGNANSQAQVKLSPNSAETIEGSKEITIKPNHYIMLVKSGSNWVKVIDSSLLSSQVPINITPEMIFNAIDRGTFTGSGSLKTLEPGWWIIPESNNGVSGKPSGSKGDLVFYNAMVGSQDGLSPKYGVALAFGKDRINNDQAWAQYRNQNGWTPWIPLYQKDGSPVDLSQITQDIADIKNNVATNTEAISSLRTDLGNVFAPDKSAFDTEANRVFTSAIKPLETHLNQIPDEVEKVLTDKGWGPLPKSGGSSGHQPSLVLPEFWALFSASIPNSLTGAVSSTTGELNIKKIGTGQERLWVVLKTSDAGKVKTIKIGDALSSTWDSRSLTIDGEQYTGFYSAGGFTTLDETITVNFGG